MRRKNVWLRQSKKENAVYNPATSEVYLLNNTALAIWDLCDGETKPEEMMNAICELTGLPPEVVAEDLERILLEFDTAELIEWVGS
ncbi:MAG TPA: PqqD family protein [Actinomycetota bacterium]|nr:PqqD family protein [Actinomycetota bacterium]